LENRAGGFQGRRGPTASNPFRYSGRVVWYPFEAETGYFYTGTTLGARKILALGASFDSQSDYHARSLDVFYDQPVLNGDGLIMQAGYSHYDGGDILQQLSPAHTWLAEAGYYFHRVKVGPFVQFAGLLYRPDLGKDSTKFTGGLAWWPQGHRINIKLGLARTKYGDDPRRIQVVVQTQFYMW
jgi:hypothetical protein